MKKVTLILLMGLVTVAAALFLNSCSKDAVAPAALKMVSVATDLGVALDGATAATGIPVNASVVVTFDRAIDVTTATSNSIAILLNGTLVAGSVTASGSAVTLKPTADMPLGTVMTVSVAPTLKATDGGLAAAAELSFKTFGRANVVPPQSSNQLSYFAFSGNMNDGVGTHTPAAADVKNLAFVTDRFGFAGLAGDFNGTTSMVEIPNGEQYIANPDFTISFWIKATYVAATPKGAFVLGLGAWKGFQFEIAGDWTWVKLASQYAEANNLSDSEDNWFPGNGQTASNGGWQGWTFQKDVTSTGGVGATYFANKWCHVVCTYQASTKLATMYLNGEKVKQHDFNLWPAGDAKKGITGVKFAGNLTGGGNKFALGFIQASLNRIIPDTWADPADPTNNHYKGQMDDLRLFKVALSATEVTTLYTAEKP